MQFNKAFKLRIYLMRSLIFILKKESFPRVLALVDDNDMQVKWRYFLRSLGDGEISFQDVMNGIEAFLEPVWNAIVGENELLKCWKANEMRWE